MFSGVTVPIPVVANISVPTCQTIAPAQKVFGDVRTARVDVPAAPFGLAYATTQEDVAFVALNTTLGVLSTKTSAPTLLHQIPLPIIDHTPGAPGGEADGIALTADGQYLVVTYFFGDSIIQKPRPMSRMQS